MTSVCVATTSNTKNTNTTRNMTFSVPAWSLACLMAVVAATATLSLKRRKTSDGDEDEEEEGVKDRTTRSSWLEPDAPPPRRILIVASSGCMGKSTLAKTVAAATGGVHLEMDDLCWTPGWQRRPPEAERKVVEEATRPESWVCAGIWGKGKELVYERCDTIVLLNHIGQMALLARLARRCFRRCVTGEPCCGGNQESLAHTVFGKDGYVRLLWRTGLPRPHDAAGLAAHILKLRQCAPNARVVCLSSPKELDAFVESLSSLSGNGSSSSSMSC